MNGDYTKVPLRAGDRWTAARMQQGRVLLDHEWNLNLDASSRVQRVEAFDVIGAAGVRDGDDDFGVSLVTTDGVVTDLAIAAGHIWAGGEFALAPADFRYADQPGIDPLPQQGKIVVYLDLFDEHVQPGERPDLIDPALQPIDTAARTRVGYRVRVVATEELTGRDAWRVASASLIGGSDATLGIAPVAPGGSGGDPCAPPADPAGALPDGLLSVEVLDGGDATKARFAWSFDNGATVAPVLTPPTTADDVLVATTPAAVFAPNDLVELSWLGRRADRIDHGDLYTVTAVTPGQDGTHLALARTAGLGVPPTGAEGLAVRRWDGLTAAGATTTVSFRGRDYLTIQPGATGTFQVGDWWGARVRDGGNDIEARTDAPPDGILHGFVQLAYVDLDTHEVQDLRPRFKPLVELTTDVCTVAIDLDTDIEAALARLPSDGGEICFAAGRYQLSDPIVFTGRQRITIHGTGPSTVIVAPPGSATAFRFEDCTEIELRNLRVVGGAPATGSGDLDGAVTFVGACVDVRINECTIACAGAAALARTCLTVRSDGDSLPDVVRIERNTFEVGAQQTAVLLVDVDESRVDDNRIALAPSELATTFGLQGVVVAGARASVVHVRGNVIRDVAQGIHVALSDSSGTTRTIDKALVAENFVRVKVPQGYDRDRHAILVGRANSIQILANGAKLDPVGAGTHIFGVHVKAPTGPLLVVRDTALDGFDVGVAVTDVDAKSVPQQKVWFVEGTMAANGVVALDAPDDVDEKRNAPMPVGGLLGGISATPNAIAPGTSATGMVTLKAPAARGGALVNLSIVKQNAADPPVANVPDQVIVPAGATQVAFTISAPAGARPAGVNVTIHAEQQDTGQPTAPTADAQFTVLSNAAASIASLTFSPNPAPPNAAVRGTVTLTQAEPGAIVALATENPAVAGLPVSSIAVASGTSASFDVALHPTNVDQKVKLSAQLHGSTRWAELAVLGRPQLKIGRIRILKVATDADASPAVLYDTADPGSSFLPGRRISLDYAFGSLATRANAIEVTFQGAAPKLSTIVANSSFVVAHATTPPWSTVAQPPNQRIVQLADPRVVRWVADGIPLPLVTLTTAGKSIDYTVTLKGGTIAATNGRLLDGELAGLPSGDGVDGGDAVFTLTLTQQTLEVDTSDLLNARRAQIQLKVYGPEAPLGPDPGVIEHELTP